LCGFGPVSTLFVGWVGTVDGSTRVLPVGPACTAMWVALWASSCFQERNHSV
jgi:hypothetical protein